MASNSIQIKRSAAKELAELPTKDRLRVERLAALPRPRAIERRDNEPLPEREGM